jgi:Concanavalin A-like lectin/glucanases superfamily/Peptide-N-glycosidase F, C terminal/Secretion system C-terminal sorting domain
MRLSTASILIFILASLSSECVFSQTPDTVVVQTFTREAQNNQAAAYDSPGRRWFNFPPSNNGVQYQKILMYYNLKCFEDGTAGNLGYPCGEWDYLTYTYLYDHTGVIDSTLATHPTYFVNNAGFDSVAMTSQPVVISREQEFEVRVMDSVVDEITIELGDAQNSSPQQAALGTSSRMLALYRASELLTAGLNSGDALSRIALEYSNALADVEVVELEIALVSDTTLSVQLNNASFTTVYKAFTAAGISSWNNFNLLSDWIWDGSSSLLVRISWFNGETAINQQWETSATSFPSALYYQDTDRYMRMDWQDEVKVPKEAFDAVSDEITIMLWQNGDAAIQPENGTMFEGVNSLNQRVLNVHLPWSNSNVYWDAGYNGGYDRINKLANAQDFEGRWNHWAFTKNCSSGEMKIYLNGVLWHTGSNLDNLMLDIERFSIGGATGWSNFYNGNVDEFSVFNVALDEATIAEWMNRDLTTDHPYWNNLQVYYPFNEEDGEMVLDASGHGHHAWMHGNADRISYRGDERWRNAIASTNRPLLQLKKGTYESHQETLVHTAQDVIPPVSIVEFGTENYGVLPISVSYDWPVQQEFLITVAGDTVLLDSVPAEYVLNNSNFSYWQHPFEVINRYELNRFITMYGIQLDLGADGWTWVVDVTDWEPLLRDSAELESGNWQELLDMKFLFIEGTPAREVKRIEPLWDTNQGLNNFDNAVTARTVQKAPNERSWKLITTNTGHQFDNPPNCAEFCNNIQSVKVNGQENWSWDILQECADNPLYPQGGTWIFDRAGWCPGMNSTTKEFELTPHVADADSFTVDYDITYNDYGNYVFFGTLVGYGENNHAHDPEIDRITAPSNWKIHSRENPICDNPRFILRNKGYDSLTHLIIQYGIVGGEEQQMEWTGNLGFMEKEEVQLTYASDSLWNGDEASTLRFYIRLADSNDGLDENNLNNYAESEFHRPPTYSYADLNDNRMIIILRTNNFPLESSYVLYNQWDEVVFERNDFTEASTIYRDTIQLNEGCYTFHLKDSDDDGLSFFANDDGSGYCKLDRVSGLDFENFERDFGKEIIHRFHFATNLETMVTQQKTSHLRVYPNPTSGIARIEAIGFGRAMSYTLYDAFGRKLEAGNIMRKNETETFELSLESRPKGLYFVELMDGYQRGTIRLIKS